ncbi:alpha/beta hydrolase [Ramlibacter ginsenosidimutans]|uniref:Alpha/beta hydrolase n=1 Tax=Ramlibacter ginsenosidimutans TaxID=502333 RepID=A0A934TTG3_9BURK|nr:alpha/beta hydrolase [Ramlibacter ginsenosidimutans]MBK6007256.1 alpha/beta hydrolase [Ramlibacter ginsenosidimutans]
MPFAESRGRRLYYERQGEGPAVLFLHGAGSNAATWWQQLPVFSPRHTCITMDIRCFGRSVAPVQEFDLDNFVADALAVLDAAGVQRAAFVGQSLGGFVGLKTALAHPERVAAFAACDSSLAIDHPVLLDAIARRRITHKAASIEQRSLGRWFLENCADKAQLYAQINHFNPSAHSIPDGEWGAALAGALGADKLIPLDALCRVACPTLLLVGSEDPIVPVRVMRELQDLVRGSELAVIDQAGHSAYFEKPDEVNRVLLDFLERRAKF